MKKKTITPWSRNWHTFKSLRAYHEIVIEELDILSVIPSKLYIAYFENIDGVPWSRD